MKIRSTLNGGSAEVDDVAAKVLIESGHWVSDTPVAEAPTRKPRKMHVAKVVPADSEE
jgi:hypothetical protein